MRDLWIRLGGGPFSLAAASAGLSLLIVGSITPRHRKRIPKGRNLRREIAEFARFRKRMAADGIALAIAAAGWEG
jgi:hypothetical protein